MAVLISCGEAESNEREPLTQLSTLLDAEWAVLSNLPRSLCGREIDALLLSPGAVVVCELKYYRGSLEVRSVGPWHRDGVPILDASKNAEATNFIDQAEKAAQTLKSALGRFDPAMFGQIYIDRMVLITHPDARLTYSRTELRDHAGLLSDAPQLLAHAAKRAKRGVPPAVLHRIFDFAEQRVPAALSSMWAAEPPVQKTEARATAPAKVTVTLPPAPQPTPRPPESPPASSAPIHGASGRGGTPHGQPAQSRIVVVAAAILVAVLVSGWVVYRVASRQSPPSPPGSEGSFIAGVQEQPTGEMLNLRTGPGQSFPAIRQIASSEVVTAMSLARASDGGLWHYVSLPDGTVGYVNARLVKVAAPAAPPPPVVQPVNIPQPPPLNIAPIGTPNSQVGAGPTVISHADVIREPSPTQISEYYPARARADRVQGQAIVECNISSDATATCELTSENPGGYGFGDAALSVSSLIGFRPETRNGTPVDGGKLRVPINFRLPQSR